MKAEGNIRNRKESNKMISVKEDTALHFQPDNFFCQLLVGTFRN